MIGEKNLSWTKFKTKYLFSLNVFLVMSIIVYTARKDFLYHWPILVWTILCLISDRIRTLEFKAFQIVGKINSSIFLTVFYFLFFCPFSVIYRIFFKNSAFKDASSRFVEKNSISDFSRPF